jgi:hypothetical protein
MRCLLDALDDDPALVRAPDAARTPGNPEVIYYSARYRPWPFHCGPSPPYNLVGHNCEIIANMCVSGGWTESYQARKFFLVRTMMDAALLFWLASRRRAMLPFPRWVSPVMVVGALASMGAKFTYDDQIRRFWNEIRNDWRAHERMLSQDPRNGQAAGLEQQRNGQWR